MKPETSAQLASLILAKRMKFIESEKGLELEYELSEQEKLELVHSEYGTTLTAPVDQLFVTIIKKLVRITQDKFSDKLSEL